LCTASDLLPPTPIFCWVRHVQTRDLVSLNWLRPQYDGRGAGPTHTPSGKLTAWAFFARWFGRARHRDTQWWQYIINYGILLFPLFLAISSFPLRGMPRSTRTG